MAVGDYTKKAAEKGRLLKKIRKISQKQAKVSYLRYEKIREEL